MCNIVIRFIIMQKTLLMFSNQEKKTILFKKQMFLRKIKSHRLKSQKLLKNLNFQYI